MPAGQVVRRRDVRRPHPYIAAAQYAYRYRRPLRAAAQGAYRAFRSYADGSARSRPYTGGRATHSSNFRSRKSPFIKKKKSIKKQVREIKKRVESDMGTHVYKRITVGTAQSALKSSNFENTSNFQVTHIQSVLSGLKYYDPADPANLTTASGSTGAFHKEFLFEPGYIKLMVKNNYDVPAKVTLYVLTPKVDGNTSPTSAFSTGLGDVGSISTTSPLSYPSDSPLLMDLWNIQKTTSKILTLGASCQMRYATKGFSYDPSLIDTHSDSFQRRLGCVFVCIRVQGLPCHDDTTADQVGFAPAKVDWIWESKHTVKYQAGADIFTNVHSDGQSAIAAGDRQEILFTGTNKTFSNL